MTEPESKPQSRHPAIARLVAEQLVTAEFAEKIESAAPLRKGKLGEILLHARILNFKQLMEILREQADRPEQRLGELAVELGFCTEGEVQWAIRRQAASTRHPLDELLMSAVLSDRVLLEFLVDYIKLQDLIADTDEDDNPPGTGPDA